MKKELSLAAWGNSSAIRIPVDFLKDLNISRDREERVSLLGEIVDNKLIIKKKEETSYYSQLFEGYEGPRERKLLDWGPDVGTENIRQLKIKIKLANSPWIHQYIHGELISSEGAGFITIRFGSILKINLSPTKGTEIKNERPVLVISNTKHNKYSGQIIILPITRTDKDYPLDIPLSRYDGRGNIKKTEGVILTEQPRTLDYKERKYEFVEFASDEDLDNVKDKFLRAVLEELYNFY